MEQLILQFEEKINVINYNNNIDKNIAYQLQDNIYSFAKNNLKQNVCFKVNSCHFINDTINIKENWCDSHQDGNKIVYYINNKVIVNDLCYSLQNIQKYQFTINDLFSFFQSIQENKFNQKDILKQSVLIKAKKATVCSDIDGRIITNNIYLSQGEHTIKYKIVNSTISKSFNVKINNFFEQDGETICFFNLNDLYKAKLIKNHVISKDNKISLF